MVACGSGVRVGTRAKVGDDGSEHDLVIACGGPQSDRLAAMLGEDRSPRIVSFYGDYFVLSRAQRDVVRGMVYLAPDPLYPFIVVHVTPCAAPAGCAPRRWAGTAGSSTTSSSRVPIA